MISNLPTKKAFKKYDEILLSNSRIKRIFETEQVTHHNYSIVNMRDDEEPKDSCYEVELKFGIVEENRRRKRNKCDRNHYVEWLASGVGHLCYDETSLEQNKTSVKLE